MRISALRPPTSVHWILVLSSIWLPVVYLLGAQWSVYPEYQYGWAVPFLCLYLAYARLRLGDRESELGVGKNQAANFHLPTSNFHGLLAFFAVVYWVMRVLQEANPLWRLASWGLAISAVMMTLCALRLAQNPNAETLKPETLKGQQETFGNSEKSQTRKLEDVSFSVFQRFRFSDFIFPVCFFLVAVPWPTPLETAIIQTLTRLNAGLVGEVLSFFGVPALLHGNVIEISAGMVGIDEACSGIRSFQATLMIALFFGEFYRLAWVRRWWLLAAGPALAMLFNFSRMLVLVLVAAHSGLPTMEKWHDPTGVALLLGCFFCLCGVAVWLKKSEKLPGEVEKQTLHGPRKAETLKAESGVTSSGLCLNPHQVFDHPLPSDGRGTSPQRGEGKSESGNQATGTAPAPGAVLRATAENPPTPSSQLPASEIDSPISILAVCLVAWSLTMAVSTEAWFRSHEARGDRAVSWSARWPVANPTFKTNAIPPYALRQLQCDDSTSASWTSKDDIFWQAFYLRWLPADSFYGRAKVALSKSHNPAICLTASGMTLETQLDPVTLPVRPGFKLNFDRFVFTAGGRKLHVFFAQTEDMSAGGQASLRSTHLARLRAALAGSRNYGQHNFEVALTGPASADAALRIFSAELPGLIDVQPQK